MNDHMQVKHNLDLDPEKPGIPVRVKRNPSRKGTTTGNTEVRGSQVMVEIDFGPNDVEFKRLNLLELVVQKKNHIDLFQEGSFGGPSDIRNILTFEKVKGELTNVFYSMEASNTDFFAHQFKPVLRFIESPVGRILLADEVGLGKTIEATYIWKEIQARHSARRLLVVCPAILREKWQYDLITRFNIRSEICDAKSLHKRLEDLTKRGSDDSFVLITSIEGIRPPRDYENLDKKSARAEISRLLEQFKVTEEFSLIDCVVIDEAHKLRNPSTMSNKLGHLLAEASNHLVLLTATPIQIKSNNLFQLLRLIDPDEFYDAKVFEEMLKANSSIVKAQRLLWGRDANAGQVLEAINEAEKSYYFRSDPVLNRIKQYLKDDSLDDSTRIKAIGLLESRSLLSHYMTRSRKREVLPNRVVRSPQVLSIRFSPEEKKVYKVVSDWVHRNSVGLKGVSLLSVILRQRQMASSVVGAIESWKDKGIMKELFKEDMENVISESDENLEIEASDSIELDDLSESIPIEPNFDSTALEEHDSKYNELRDFLQKKLSENPNEKFVLFAYFRGTLNYLQRRLNSDNISSTIIMGNLGANKSERIQEFASENGPSVLLSSEVGSEGIDLQFCNILVNYDLPWNPMRVEQRIGRLDRLGQRAERISIINLAVEDTIEDRILIRLYDRIEVFKESIGDMEDILGELTKKIVYEILVPDLSIEEREKLMEESAQAHLNTRKQTQELEKQAINLIGFTDYILNEITNSRKHGRWLSGEELSNLVCDFFANQYSGTKINVEKDSQSAEITLSDRATDDFSEFIRKSQPATFTRLHRSQGKHVSVIFDPRNVQTTKKNVEFIEPTHPLIKWIRSTYEDRYDQLHNVAAIKLDSASTDFDKGDYVFSIQRWSFNGLKTDNFLFFSAFHVDGNNALSEVESESLVSVAARKGKSFVNAKNVIGDMEPYLNALKSTENKLGVSYDSRTDDLESENEIRCEQQKISAVKYAERHISELNERIERFKVSGRDKLIPMTQGLVDKHKKDHESKLRRIDSHRNFDSSYARLASGIIRII